MLSFAGVAGRAGASSSALGGEGLRDPLDPGLAWSALPVLACALLLGVAFLLGCGREAHVLVVGAPR